jgi:effector-binding domain-containing protein
MDTFDKIRTAMNKAGLQAGGRPIAVFINTDDQGFHFDAMIPLVAAPSGMQQLTPDIRIGASPSGKAMKFQHRGAYDDIDSTYEAITAFLDEKDLEAKDFFVEEYLNDIRESDDENLAVDIYVFLQ